MHFVRGIGFERGIDEGTGAVDEKLAGKQVLADQETSVGEIRSDALQIDAALHLAVADEDETSLRIHGEGAAGGGVRQILDTEQVAGLRINGDALKVFAIVNHDVGRGRIGTHIDEEFLGVGRLSEAGGDGPGNEFDEGDWNKRRRAGIDLESLHQTFAGKLTDEINDGDVLAGGFDGDEGGAFGVGGGEGRVRNFLVGAGGGIGDVVHMDAVSARAEKEAALNVDGEILSGGIEGRAGNGGEGAGLIVAENYGATGAEDEGLRKLGQCQIGTAKNETSEGE